MKTSMKRRIALGAPLLAVLGGLFWLDWHLQCRICATQTAWPLAAVFVPLMILGVHEMAHICAGAGVRILKLSASAGALVVGSIPFWWQWMDRQYHGYADHHLSGFGLLVVLSVLMIVMLVEQMIRDRAADAARQIACTLLTVMYLGLGGAMILAVRMAYGVPALVLFVAAVKFTDMGAYFVGSAIGRHKLIPWLSPGKTWEGLVGGIAAGVGTSLLAGWLLRVGLGAGQLAIFGVLMALAGQLGDLCESLLKRAGNVKDSGTLVPEFGGVLDMLDSLLLAAPFAYAALTWMTAG